MLIYLPIADASEVSDYLSASDIFFAPNALQGIPQSLFEAMAHGVTIVGADAGGTKELFNVEQQHNAEDSFFFSRSGQTPGFLISNEGSQEDVVNRYVSRFKQLLQEPQKLSKMGHYARSVMVKYFDLQLLGECLIDKICLAHENHRTQHQNVRVIIGSTAIAIANQAMEYMRLQQKK